MFDRLAGERADIASTMRAGAGTAGDNENAQHASLVRVGTPTQGGALGPKKQNALLLERAEGRFGL